MNALPLFRDSTQRPSVAGAEVPEVRDKHVVILPPSRPHQAHHLPLTVTQGVNILKLLVSEAQLQTRRWSFRESGS